VTAPHCSTKAKRHRSHATPNVLSKAKRPLSGVAVAPISGNPQRPRESKAAPFRGRGGTDLRQPPTSSRKQSGPFPGPLWYRSHATPNVLTKAKRPLSGAAVAPISGNARLPHESKAAPLRGRCGTDLTPPPNVLTKAKRPLYGAAAAPISRRRPTSSRKQSGPSTGPLQRSKWSRGDSNPRAKTCWTPPLRV